MLGPATYHIFGWLRAATHRAGTASNNWYQSRWFRRSPVYSSAQSCDPMYLSTIILISPLEVNLVTAARRAATVSGRFDRREKLSTKVFLLNTNGDAKCRRSILAVFAL